MTDCQNRMLAAENANSARYPTNEWLFAQHPDTPINNFDCIAPSRLIPPTKAALALFRDEDGTPRRLISEEDVKKTLETEPVSKSILQ